MTIRRITSEYSSDVLSIIHSTDNFQNLPKEALMASIHDPDKDSEVSLFDRFVSKAVPSDMDRQNAYWFGNFSDEDELVALIKFDFWLDPDTQKYCWTLKPPHQKIHTDYNFSYTYELVPDEIIDLVNHGVDLAESRGMITGYSILQNAVSNKDHPNYLSQIVDCVNPKSIRICYDRYLHEEVEVIKGGEFSTSEKFRLNVNTVRFSINTKIIRMTRIV